MKKIFLLSFLLFFLVNEVNSQTYYKYKRRNTSASQVDITLFDSDGDATAYIDTDGEDLTIYLWNGKPVAYLDPDGDAYNIYGFNGKHLGWFEDGIVRDHKGNAVGFREGATSVATKYEPYKSYKAYKPYKAYKEYAPYKPYYKNTFSGESLSLFLSRGKK